MCVPQHSRRINLLAANDTTSGSGTGSDLKSSNHNQDDPLALNCPGTKVTVFAGISPRLDVLQLSELSLGGFVAKSVCQARLSREGPAASERAAPVTAGANASSADVHDSTGYTSTLKPGTTRRLARKQTSNHTNMKGNQTRSPKANIFRRSGRRTLEPAFQDRQLGSWPGLHMHSGSEYAFK